MPFDPTLPHPLPEIDPKLFDELLGESKLRLPGHVR